MVYKKYIKKDGKLYGPYIYQSKRVDGKVVSEYCGQESKLDYKKITIFVVGILVLVSLILFIFSLKNNITGNVILNKQLGSQKEFVQQDVSISLKEGELIPASSKIIFETKDNNYEYALSELVLDEETFSGSYYIEGNSISGSGEGYGLKGEEIDYPSVYFTLVLKKDNKEDKKKNSEEVLPLPFEENISETEEVNSEILEDENLNEDETQEEIPEETEETEEDILEENTNYIEPLEQLEEETEEVNSEILEDENLNEDETQEEIPEETEETLEQNSLPLTGGVISNFFNSISKFFLGLGITGKVTDSEKIIEINGEVSKENPFIYSLDKGESIELLSGSVRTDSTSLNDNAIKISYEENQVIIETTYSEIKEGFGESYLGNNEKIIHLKIPEELLKENSNIKIIYDEQNLLSTTEDLQVQLDSKNNVLKIGPLTDAEKEILFDKDSIVKTIKSELFNGRYIVGYEFNGYTIEYSYDSQLDKESLNYQMEKDRLKWLRDIIQKISEEKPSSEKIEDFNLDFEI